MRNEILIKNQSKAIRIIPNVKVQMPNKCQISKSRTFNISVLERR